MVISVTIKSELSSKTRLLGNSSNTFILTAYFSVEISDIYKLSCVMLYKEMCQHFKDLYNSVHFCSLTQLCPTLCDPMDCSTPGLPAPHHLLEFAQIHIHCIGDAIQPSHPLRPSSPSALNLSQHQRLF